MISILTLERCLQKCNPNLWIYFNPNSEYDILPARLYHRDTELISVPKGMVYENTRKAEDGSILHRGYRDIIKILVNSHLVQRDKIMKYINRAGMGMIV